MQKFIIRCNSTGNEVCGFSQRWGIVQWTVKGWASSSKPKLFTENSLRKFVETYTACGYGFDITDCTVVAVAHLRTNAGDRAMASLAALAASAWGKPPTKASKRTRKCSLKRKGM